MHKFKKPSGAILDVHPNSVEQAKKLGWEEVKETKQKSKPKAKKRGNSTNSN